MGAGKYFEHLKTNRFANGQRPVRHKSIAVWPDTISVGNRVDKNESEDLHDSKEAAEAVCSLLHKHGFGGDGKVFPLSTRVEPAE